MSRAEDAVSMTSARERLRPSRREQRSRDRRILIIVAAGIVVLLVGGGIGFQALADQPAAQRRPGAGSRASTPVTITDGQPIVLGKAGAGADRRCTRTSTARTAPSSRRSSARPSTGPAGRQAPVRALPDGLHRRRVRPRPPTRWPARPRPASAEPTTRACSPTTPWSWSDEQLIDLAGEVSGGRRHGRRSQTCVTSEASTPAGCDSINAAADQHGVTGTPTMFLDGNAGRHRRR